MWHGRLAHVFVCEAPVPLKKYSQYLHLHELLFRPIDPNWIPQRPAETDECHHHHVAILQLQLVLEAEAIGAQEMNVGITGMAVLGVLEMMMLEIRQRVRHV